jgi:hypothetical protein
VSWPEVINLVPFAKKFNDDIPLLWATIDLRFIPSSKFQSFNVLSRLALIKSMLFGKQ